MLKTAELFCAPILSAPDEEASLSAPESADLWRLRVTMFLYLSSFWMASCSDLTFSLWESGGGAAELAMRRHGEGKTDKRGERGELGRERTWPCPWSPGRWRGSA